MRLSDLQVFHNAPQPSLLLFTRPGCRACENHSLNALQSGYAFRVNIVSIDHASSPELVHEYKIHTVPTIVASLRGTEVGRITGISPQSVIDKLVDGAVALAGDHFNDPEASRAAFGSQWDSL